MDYDGFTLLHLFFGGALSCLFDFVKCVKFQNLIENNSIKINKKKEKLITFNLLLWMSINALA